MSATLKTKSKTSYNMYNRLMLLLNIKPSETELVKRLFLVQFFLGVATAFLFTSSLAIFLSAYPIQWLPRIYMLAAGLLLVFNLLYAQLEAHLASEKLLGVIILFSVISLILYWLGISYISNHWLPLFLAVWNMIIYMVVGYAFWGMAAVLFNVRESKRLFSIVGAGDIPAKMLGYSLVPALAYFVPIKDLLWVSILAFLVAYFLLKKFSLHAPPSHEHHPSGASHLHHPVAPPKSLLEQYFHNNLILVISLWSLLAYIIFSLIDFTFLSDIKSRYTEEKELATFIGVFFAVGRLLAIFIKLLFSSRMIARLGLANSLLVTPVLLFFINAIILFTNTTLTTHLYVFGGMALLAEILRSALQEPVFFILFQPLNPHVRLRGHLIAKGYTFPFALLGVGLFLALYFQSHETIAITLVAKLLTVLLVLWGVSVFFIRKQYLHTLVSALKKGYFTGSELFLNDEKVTNTLLRKTQSHKPLEVIHALNLLERSGYQHLKKLLLEHIHHAHPGVQEFVLSRIIHHNLTDALPLIKAQLATTSQPEVKLALTKALFFLDYDQLENQVGALRALDADSKKAAMIGLLSRSQVPADVVVMQELAALAESPETADKMLAIEIIKEARKGSFTKILAYLLQDENPLIYTSTIEAIGEVKDFSLLVPVLQRALAKHALNPLQRCLFSYGDELFTTAHLQEIHWEEQLYPPFIKVAAKLKGDFSTKFLVRLLRQEPHYADNLIGALWAKKANLPPGAEDLIESWIQNKLYHAKIKMNYYQHLAGHAEVKLLLEALHSEIQQDMLALLKALYLIYDRQKIERVIELYKLGDSAKISNAIEMLELLIPKKFFLGLNTIVELLLDIHNNQIIIPTIKTMTINAVLNDILGSNHAGCNVWTQAVALYLLPECFDQTFPVDILQKKNEPEDPLLEETRNYVASVLTEA